jgi:hypothetical protein
VTPTPDFEELVGADLSPEEQARLRRAHDLLIAAGPPPELPPALAEPGAVEAETTRSSTAAVTRRSWCSPPRSLRPPSASDT